MPPLSRWILTGAFLGLFIASQASAQMRSFPQHVEYASGSILPNHVSQSVMDGKVTAFYRAWKANFLRQGCGNGRYYAWLGPQNPIDEGRPISVSEMQGYAMMIVAYMAGHEPSARTIFNGLYNFYRDHPSQHSPDLMAWRQMDDCKSSNDPNSAADGDIAIAYALLLAHRQWGSGSTIDYRAEALSMIAAIRQHEMHPTSELIQMGDWVHPAYPLEYNAVRTSDFMPAMFKAFKRATGTAEWPETIESSYRLLNTMQLNHAPVTGLVPDFIVDATTKPSPAPAGFNGDYRAGTFAYNACRVPWLVGLDFLMSGEPRSKRFVQKLEDWITAETDGDIYQLYAGYELNGTPTVGYSYVCFTGAIGVGAMVDAKYQRWLNRIWDDVAITFVDQPTDAYGANLRLLYMLVMSGNWWVP